MSEPSQHDQDLTPTTEPGPARALQPALHELTSSVAAPGLVLAPSDGQVAGSPLAGWYVDDVRALSLVRVELEGSPLELVRSAAPDAATVHLEYVARALGDPGADPTVFVERRREVTGTTLAERITVRSRAHDVEVPVVLHVLSGTDLAPMTTVKLGRTSSPVGAEADGGGLAWAGGGHRVVLAARPEPAGVAAEAGRVSWSRVLGPGDELAVTLRWTWQGAGPTTFAAGGEPPWSVPDVEAADLRVRRLVRQGFDDLAGLLLRDGHDPDADRFLAAGSPWFLTLFGRDSLWAARMLLPFGTDLALSTLRTLARRQGTREVPETEEQPGKILHEVRGGTLDLGELTLPPLYYGSVDATPLFVVVLAEAHRWGAPRDQVEALLPAARRCLEWVLAQSRESSWLRYIDHSGSGLSNQGWKDSVDSVQYADGSLAEPPIALSEVQAYAHQAVREGSALLREFGVTPPPGLDAWAEDLRSRFAEEFWVPDEAGPYPAIALDGAGRRVDSVASNMGHLLGTGLVDADEARLIADRLSAPALDSGFGLRTLTRESPRFSPLSYHGGTVWPHDTAVAVAGLAAEGFLTEAGRLTAGLVAASEGFGYRLPELYGGDAATDVPLPSAYPAACRPQAWAAAAPLAALVGLTGLRAESGGRRLRHAARVDPVLGAYTVSGLRLGEEQFSLTVTVDGTVTVTAPPGVEVVSS